MAVFSVTYAITSAGTKVPYEAEVTSVPGDTTEGNGEAAWCHISPAPTFRINSYTQTYDYYCKTGSDGTYYFNLRNTGSDRGAYYLTVQSVLY